MFIINLNCFGVLSSNLQLSLIKLQSLFSAHCNSAACKAPVSRNSAAQTLKTLRECKWNTNLPRQHSSPLCLRAYRIPISLMFSADFRKQTTVKLGRKIEASFLTLADPFYDLLFSSLHEGLRAIILHFEIP